MSERAHWKMHEDWMARAGVAEQDFPFAALYVVALPLGNAADITLRAIAVLARVDAIAAEDTRTTRPLLARFGIDTPLLAAHQHNEREAAATIVARIAQGQRIALVTDAGTPAVSDPGALIVRAALDAGQRVIPIPGASSVASAVSIAGLAGPAFRFAGFLPVTADKRRHALDDLAAQPEPFVVFEAPHRVRTLLAELAACLAPDRRVVIARELTKKFEQVSVHAAKTLAALEVPERGEFVFVVDAAPAEQASLDARARRLLELLAAELPAARAAAVASKATGVPREELYQLLKRRAD
jgi:16S rRNA (cytidine1402-2'-O)-methyltransferase